MIQISEIERANANHLLLELRKPENKKTYEKLKNKCNWEHMTLLGVILQYGDPREW